ncbi:alpha/beta-hydrolase [Lentithecium fluviatile CBS 122367]|uniref:Alpha/beta-hydrolase n=1 Tax=Lentithecium fluviatile CBS 122367 TaxID=1168545 RepID=A0A6G1IN89_9PLEO|nr:alpha/beta-hydrolase [Lentithecium fluviatile CBS 122367]
MSILSTQPFKTLYALSATTFELFCLPLWILRNITVRGRQHPSWTFRQSLSVRLLFAYVYHIAKIQIRTPLPLTPGKEAERFIVVRAKKEDEEKYFRGPLVGNPDVRLQDVGGTWYPAPLSRDSDVENVLVVLHIHGGAYVTGDGRTEATGFLAKNLLKHTPATHVLAPQYRLSTLPASKTSNPFPAALQDSLTTYLYLLHELKIPARNVVISGDSAGANNAIALLRYLAEYGEELGIEAPSAALLWSPWLNTADNTPEFTLTNPNYATDYLSHPFTWWGSTAYAGLGGQAALENGYASPNGRPFRTQVPLWVNCGGAEALFFDDREWAEMMEKEGNKVRFDVEEGAPHDVLLVGNLCGFEEAAGRGAKRAGEWLGDVRK